MTTPLEKEYEHYLEIREELAKNNDGKFVAIKGEEVLGVFDDYLQAAKAVYIAHEKGTVLMQKVSRDPDDLIAVLHTPGIVSFS